MNKKFLRIITFTLVLALVLPGKLVFANFDANEQPSAWAVQEVREGIELGLVASELQNNYEKTITREEFCSIAVRLIARHYNKNIDDVISEKGLVKPSADTFIDTNNPDVLAAKALGITSGTSENTFSPNQPLSRQQAAKFLSKIAEACDQTINAQQTSYADSNQIANWASKYVDYVSSIGVMNGVGENKFAPKATYQRQQAIVTAVRMYNAIEANNKPAQTTEQTEQPIENQDKKPAEDQDKKPAEDQTPQENHTKDLSNADVENFITFKPCTTNFKAVHKTTTLVGKNVSESSLITYYKYDKAGGTDFETTSTRQELSYDGELKHLTIHWTPADRTYQKTYYEPFVDETFDGNQLNSQFLDPDEYNEYIKPMSKDLTLELTNLNGYEVIHMKGTFQYPCSPISHEEFWYSTKYKILIKKITTNEFDENDPKYVYSETNLVSLEENPNFKPGFFKEDRMH